MDDLRAHFLIMLGDTCAAAALAGLQVEVRTAAGTAVGVPRVWASDDPAETVDDTGYAQMLSVDGTVVALDDVLAFGVVWPHVLAVPEPGYARVNG